MTAIDPWKKKVELFRSRFVAREDRFFINMNYWAPVTDAGTGVTTFEERKSIMPACTNHGDQNLCLITQRKGRCLECSNRVYSTLTDEVIWKHLEGEQQLILIMLREEGIRFGACDFDKGTVFEDAKAVHDLSWSYGLPCYIANSRSKGYHVYWFFDTFVPAHHFNSFIRHIYMELGFTDRYMSNPALGLPEVFPKQTVYSNTATGNGIRVPMMITQMRQGRNCWVSKEDGSPVPFDKQWEFLENTKFVQAEIFERILKEKEIEILMAPASRTLAEARKLEGKDVGNAGSLSKPFGEFSHVIEGCPAMREYWAKNEKGEYTWDKSNPKGLFHNARLASMMIGVATTNGVEALKKRWATSQTDYYIKQAQAAGYRPVTCRWMQEQGVCHVNKHPRLGDHCMKKLPPVEYDNGHRIVNPDNLPEEQWPEPSPIRYATDRNLTTDEIIERLGMIYKAVNEKPKIDEVKFDEKTGQPIIEGVLTYEDPDERINGLLTRVAMLDAADKEKVTSAIRANKWMTKKQLDAYFKRINKNVEEAKAAEKKKNYLHYRFDGADYYVENGTYTKTTLDAKGIPIARTLTNFTVEIQEEVIAMRLNEKEDIGQGQLIEDRSIKGVICLNGQRLPFDVPYNEWFASSDSFFRTLQKYAGTSLVYRRADYDDIRNAIGYFSEQNKKISRRSKMPGNFILNGQEVYLTPSVMIDKDTIQPNKDFKLVLEGPLIKDLDFKILDESRFRELCTHIITDFFACNSSIYTMTSFAHAMAAAIIPQIARSTRFNNAPILWLGGGFGGGKTFVADAAMAFFGNFESKANSTGSAKAKVGDTNAFRHSITIIDDYKQALQDSTGQNMSSAIQTIYDRSARTALRQDGRMRPDADRCRGLVIVTGEDFPTNEVSSLSRLILVDTELWSDRERGKFVQQNKQDYCGFTPHFIQFVYNLSVAEIRELWDSYYSQFHGPLSDKYKQLGADRVCENITMNMLAFRLAMDMMVAKGAIPEVMRDEKCRIHQKNLEMIKSGMLRTILSNRGSEQFLDGLRQLLQTPGRYVIFNWPGHSDIEEGWTPQQLGFWREETPDVVYIYPQVAHAAVSELVTKSKDYTQKLGQVTRLLYEDGWLTGVSEAEKASRKYRVSKRAPTGNSVRVWSLKLEALGLEPPKPKSPEPVPTPSQENDDGQGNLAVI
jgi:hypothetical protein